MKILPVYNNHTFVCKSQNNSKIYRFKFNSAADTVSFKASKNIIETSMEELQNSFNNEILPFINDSRESFTSIAKIGYSVQEPVQVYQKANNDLFSYQLSRSLSVNNPDYKLYGKYIELVKEFDKNKNNYNYFKALSKKDFYKKSGLDKEVARAEHLYIENENIEKLRPFYNYFNKISENFSKEISHLNLKEASKEEYDRYLSLKNIYDSCIMFALAIPYSDSVKVQKDIKELQNSISKPDMPIYDKLKLIERVQRQINHITETKNWFYNNKKEIEQFVKTNSEFLNNKPDISTIMDLYRILINKTDEKYNKYRKYIKICYEASEHLPDSEIAKLSALIEKQNKVNNKIIENL